MNDQAPLLLQDVILPTPAPWNWGWAIVGAVILMITILAVFLRYKRRKSPNKMTLRESLSIDSIQTLWQNNGLSDRQTAFFLAKLLCDSVKIKRLTDKPPVNFDCSKSQWDEFLAIINGLRYQYNSGQKLKLHIFTWVKRWLAAEKPSR